MRLTGRVYTPRHMKKLLACWILVAACASKVPVSDDFTDLQGQDEKSDSFSYRMKIVGTIGYGDATSPVTYNKSPRYRAYKFDGYEGDRVDTWIRSPNGGDAVTWLLDGSFKVLASNDDADDGTLDSHISFTLPASQKAVHYLVYRDYALATAKFAVELAVQPYDTSCATDADCVMVDRGGCCPNGTGFAVATDSVDDYAAAVACNVTPHPLCPQHILNETRVAQCNTEIGRCYMVAAEDIHCGGFIATAHQCPDGYVCQLQAGHPDVGGSCLPDAQP